MCCNFPPDLESMALACKEAKTKNVTNKVNIKTNALNSRPRPRPRSRSNYCSRGASSTCLNLGQFAASMQTVQSEGLIVVESAELPSKRPF